MKFVVFIFIFCLLNWPKNNRFAFVFKVYKMLLIVVVNRNLSFLKNKSPIFLTLLAIKYFSFAYLIFTKDFIK